MNKTHPTAESCRGYISTKFCEFIFKMLKINSFLPQQFSNIWVILAKKKVFQTQFASVQSIVYKVLLAIDGKPLMSFKYKKRGLGEEMLRIFDFVKVLEKWFIVDTSGINGLMNHDQKRFASRLDSKVQ